MRTVYSISVFLFLAASSGFAEQMRDSSAVVRTVKDTVSVVASGGADALRKASASQRDSGGKGTQSIVEESEEDLFLDGGEESIIAPAVTEPSQPKAAAVDSTVLPPPSAATADTAAPHSDSASAGQEQPVFYYPAEAMPKIDDEQAPPAKVEKIQSIDFAKNYKEYRSPKVAILLSLFFPGAGQAYAHNLLKTGIFGAVEAAFITASAVVAYRGTIKRKEARQFANEHYSADSFRVYYKKLITRFSNAEEADSIVFGFETPPDTFFRYANEKIKNQDYYNIISREVSPYIHGWDDATPRVDENFTPIDDTDYVYLANKDSIYLVYRIDKNGDTSLAQYGFSENIKVYNNLLSKSNSLFRSSERLITIMLLNHIVSAVDAAITAKAYNDRLLGRKSVWQRVNIKEKYVRTPLGSASGFALEVRF